MFYQNNEGIQAPCVQLLKELEAGKQSGEELGWLSPMEVRKHFSEREEKELGYTELDLGN